MTAELERRYRRALGWYPRSWRAENGDEVLGVLLDVADAEGRGRLRAGESADLARNGLLTRLRMLPGFVPPSVRDRAADVALASGAMLALVMFVAVEWSPWAPRPTAAMATFGALASPAAVVYTLWAGAFVAAFAGSARVSRWLALGTLPLWVAVRAVSDLAGYDLRPSLTTTALFSMFALLAASGRPARGERGAVRLAVAGVVSLLAFAIPAGSMLQRHGSDAWMLRPPHLPWAIEWLPWVIVALAILLRFAGQDGWAGAALLSGVPWLLYVVFGSRDIEDIVAIAGLMAVAAILLSGMLALVRMLGFRVTVQRVRR